MIQADELRIGNYVLIYRTLSTVTGIHRSDKSIVVNPDDEKNNLQKYIDDCIAQTMGCIEVENEDDNVVPFYSEKYIEGVPLTEEWLLKLGLAKSSIVGRFDFAGLNLQSNDGYFYLDYTDQYGEQEWCMEHKMKYVHQLQNLYFALTGEELNIKRYA